MFRVKSYLEKLLNEKYQQSLAPTLRALEDICKKTDTELTQINTQLQQHDIHVCIFDSFLLYELIFYILK